MSPTGSQDMHIICKAIKSEQQIKRIMDSCILCELRLVNLKHCLVNTDWKSHKTHLMKEEQKHKTQVQTFQQQSLTAWLLKLEMFAAAEMFVSKNQTQRSKQLHGAGTRQHFVFKTVQNLNLWSFSFLKKWLLIIFLSIYL